MKTSKSADLRGIEQFLDEAKSMIKIDTYHDHIVNLQGVTYTWDAKEKMFTDVSDKNL